LVPGDTFEENKRFRGDLVSYKLRVRAITIQARALPLNPQGRWRTADDTAVGKSLEKMGDVAPHFPAIFPPVANVSDTPFGGDFR
jgi:hypothetical protein